MGVANAFAAGLFISIALIHVQPEYIIMYNDYMSEEETTSEESSGSSWSSLTGEEEAEEEDAHAEGDSHDHSIFPLPQIMLFTGYVLILLVDRVLFDTHGLLDAKKAHKELAHSDGV